MAVLKHIGDWVAFIQVQLQKQQFIYSLTAFRLNLIKPVELLILPNLFFIPNQTIPTNCKNTRKFDLNSWNAHIRELGLFQRKNSNHELQEIRLYSGCQFTHFLAHCLVVLWGVFVEWGKLM